MRTELVTILADSDANAVETLLFTLPARSSHFGPQAYWEDWKAVNAPQKASWRESEPFQRPMSCMCEKCEVRPGYCYQAGKLVCEECA